MPKKKASSAQPSGSSSTPRRSSTPWPTSTSTSPSPGPDFSASAVPSLKEFVREVTRSVPSPLGGTVYQQWKTQPRRRQTSTAAPTLRPAAEEVNVGDLGSGSDFTPFLQHIGVPSTDIGSEGPYGVYHSVFDNYAWFTQNADPHFLYLQQMARVLGLEALRMADADVLPLRLRDLRPRNLLLSRNAAKKSSGIGLNSLDFVPAQAAAARFPAAARAGP